MTRLNPMFGRLRLTLTILYLVAALALIALVGIGTYGLVDQYFQSGTDLALRERMALEMAALGVPLPSEIADARSEWIATRNSPPPPARVPPSQDGDDHNAEHNQHEQDEYAYNSELASIFVLPLASDGALLTATGGQASPNGANIANITPDSDAFQAALTGGSDLRTVDMSDGTRVRLLTYKISSAQAGLPAALQLGRTLGDQDRTLNQLLLILLGLGGVSAVLLGAASWALAGRSIRPAHEAWEKQKAFIANASHELRAPLTLVRAGAEVAMRHTPPGNIEQKETLQDVLDECDHMGRLVEDLLLISRLDAGRLELQTEPVDLAELMTDVQRQVGRVAEERGVQVTVANASGPVKADRTRLRQVLLILLDNALRHTPSGGSITLSTTRQDRRILIEVIDTGSGIAPEHLPHIFEPFYSADNSRNGGSSGLGLSIASKLIEAHGGRISISSQPGQGTRVTVSLQ